MAENIITVIRKIKQRRTFTHEAEEAPPPPMPTEADTGKVKAVIQKATRHVLRVERFVSLGLGFEDAEELAKRLAWRDSDMDARTACAECAHLHGRPGAWRCGNYRSAGVGAPAHPGVFVADALQHCPGFKHSRC